MLMVLLIGIRCVVLSLISCCYLCVVGVVCFCWSCVECCRFCCCVGVGCRCCWLLLVLSCVVTFGWQSLVLFVVSVVANSLLPGCDLCR